MNAADISRSFKISAACASSKGNVRGNNEDNFYFNGKYLEAENDGTVRILTAAYGTSVDPKTAGHFFAVYDGMGGTQYGEIASFTAASGTEHLIEEYKPAHVADVEACLSEMCTALNIAVYREGLELAVSVMGTTLAGCYFYQNRAWCCNVGDSKCLRLRDGVLQQLSIDHNDAESLRIIGITGRKPSLTQFLGIDPEEQEICPEISSDELVEGDIYLICSDGLTDMVSFEKITEILRTAGSEEDMVCVLVDEAAANGGRDNITVIVCRIS